MQTANYPITDAGTIDMGDEFPSQFMTPSRSVKSPLMADFGGDQSNWSSAPRPAVTAYEGADMDAYYFNGVWLHCQTGQEWMK